MTMDVSDFVSAVHVQPPTAQLCATGELDAFTSRQVLHQFLDAVDGGCTHLRMDLAEVTFIDAAGIGLLVRMRRTAAEVGGQLEIIAASSCVRRLCALLGLTDVFDLEPDPRTAADSGGVLRRIAPRWRRRRIA